MPNGDILVAESNAPPKESAPSGPRAWMMGLMKSRAGAGGKSTDRITLLRDADGVAETKSVFLKGLKSPFGMALVGDGLFIANTDAILRFPYSDGQTEIQDAGTEIADLPAADINHHWTKNIIASKDGLRLYATTGSNSNVAEHGIAKEEGRAAIHEIDLETGAQRLFATGLRNPNGLAWQPDSGELWTVVNERDELGSDLVPDYMTSVKAGGFYGWPYCYFGNHPDPRIEPPAPDTCKKALVPDYALGPHTGSLGLAFYDASLFPQFTGGAIVGQHGSWNREPRSGYKVIFVPFKDGVPSGQPQDLLTGFVNEDGEALGRPVGVLVQRSGAILVADDVGNAIWRLTPAQVSAVSGNQ